jgi:hypothetical protein
MKIPSDIDVIQFARSLGENPTSLFPRETVQEVGCPTCHALPNQPCIGRIGFDGLIREDGDFKASG